MTKFVFLTTRHKCFVFWHVIKKTRQQIKRSTTTKQEDKTKIQQLLQKHCKSLKTKVKQSLSRLALCVGTHKARQEREIWQDSQFNLSILCVNLLVKHSVLLKCWGKFIFIFIISFSIYIKQCVRGCGAKI